MVRRVVVRAKPPDIQQLRVVVVMGLGPALAIRASRLARPALELAIAQGVAHRVLRLALLGIARDPRFLCRCDRRGVGLRVGIHRSTALCVIPPVAGTVGRLDLLRVTAGNEGPPLTGGHSLVARSAPDALAALGALIAET